MVDTVLEARVAAVRQKISQACMRAGRLAHEVTLIGVTKTFPDTVIDSARRSGLRDLGENKVQELQEKAHRFPGEIQGGDLRWHMIGHLQRNKVKDLISCIEVFHGLDSLRLALEIEKRAAAVGRILDCLVQVNVSKEGSKFGIAPEETHVFLDALAGFTHVRIIGLMTLASPADDPQDVRPQFRLLRELRDAYEAPSPSSVALKELSMGMSSDFEVAVEEGATMVRIGSTLFGERIEFNSSPMKPRNEK